MALATSALIDAISWVSWVSWVGWVNLQVIGGLSHLVVLEFASVSVSDDARYARSLWLWYYAMTWQQLRLRGYATSHEIWGIYANLRNFDVVG